MEEKPVEKSNYAKRPIWQWVALYLIIGVIIYGAFYYFFLAKKGGNSYNTTNIYSQPTPAVTSSQTPNTMVGSDLTVNLSPENNSSESGTAILKEENGKTTVTLNLTGFKNGVSQPAHIHLGSCPGVGAVKYPLTNVINGQSVTVLALTLADLKKSLPLALNVHKSENEISVYTACGALSL